MKTENILEAKTEVEILRDGIIKCKELCQLTNDRTLHQWLSNIEHEADQAKVSEDKEDSELLSIADEFEKSNSEVRTFTLEEVELILLASSYSSDRSLEPLPEEAKLTYFSFINLVKQQKKKEVLE